MKSGHRPEYKDKSFSQIINNKMSSFYFSSVLFGFHVSKHQKNHQKHVKIQSLSKENTEKHQARKPETAL